MNAHPSSRSTVFRSCVVIAAADAAVRSGGFAGEEEEEAVGTLAGLPPCVRNGRTRRKGGKEGKGVGVFRCPI
jgi:hypothetical protein